MEVKKIKKAIDIESLVLGDQYIIEPEGLDYQNPESFFSVQKEIKELEEIADKHTRKLIEKEEKEKADKVQKQDNVIDTSKMGEKEIIAYASSIGLTLKAKDQRKKEVDAISKMAVESGLIKASKE